MLLGKDVERSSEGLITEDRGVCKVNIEHRDHINKWVSIPRLRTITSAFRETAAWNPRRTRACWHLSKKTVAEKAAGCKPPHLVKSCSRRKKFQQIPGNRQKEELPS